MDVNNIRENYDVVTFDVFDTLVIRDVLDPTDVFNLIGGKKFRYARVLAELMAVRNSRREEITLEEIYKYLPMCSMDDETEKEIQICRANPKVKKLYEYCKENKIPVYAISDMYLPEKTIRTILEKCGYEMDGIYVSSTYGVKKSTGKLFQLFLKEERINLEHKKVLHIGDDQKSDGRGAKLAGITSCRIYRDKNLLSYTKVAEKNEELAAYINHQLNRINTREEQIGYEVLGPLLLAFCQFVHENYRTFHFDKLFFLARDMKLIYQIYSKLYPEDASDYFLCSHKSIDQAQDFPAGLKKYMEKMGFSGDVAVVDVGWRGISQPLLEEFAGKQGLDTSVGGLYMGGQYGYVKVQRSPKSDICFWDNKFGYMRNETYSSMLESLLGNFDDRTIGYKEDGSPYFETNNKEKDNYSLVQRIQSSAIHFVNDWVRDKNNKSIDVDLAYSTFVHMEDNPREKDIQILKYVEYDDKGTNTVLIEDVQLSLMNAENWLGNLEKSSWKGAFFKKTVPHFSGALYKGYLLANSLRLSMKDAKLTKEMLEEKKYKTY